MYDKNPSHTSVPPFKACLDKRKRTCQKKEEKSSASAHLLGLVSCIL